MTRRRRLLLASAAIVAFLVVVPGAVADESYADTRGDAGPGTDITEITVRNTPEGLIQFQIAAANAIVANHAMAVYMDADRNASTGAALGPLGIDYWMFGGPQTGVAFLAWSGSGFVVTQSPSFFAGPAAGNVTEFRINRAEVGNTAAFAFIAASISVDGNNVNFWDVAPNSGAYSYTLEAPPPSPPAPPPPPPPPPPTVKLSAGKPAAVAPATAGRALTLAMIVRRSDGRPAAGRVTCAGKVGKRSIKGSGRLTQGVARCTMRIPRGTKGQRLRGTMTAQVGNAKVTRPFSLRVR